MGANRRSVTAIRRRARRAPAVALAVLTLVVAGLVVGLLAGQLLLAGQVSRVEVGFDTLRDRPARVTSGEAARAVNILVLGAEPEAPGGSGFAPVAARIPGARRTDPVLVLHVDGDRRGASAVWLPQDAWVRVPGAGRHRVEDAFSLVGPTLAVATVERLSGVRIDHLALVDWAGVEALADDVGGVDVVVAPAPTGGLGATAWTGGTRRLSGLETRRYVQHGLSGGDLEQVRREQLVVQALVGAVRRTVPPGDLVGAYGLLDTLTDHLTVDAEWSTHDMRSLLLDLQGLAEDDLTFLTAAVEPRRPRGPRAVAQLELDEADESLWAAVREDRVDEWVVAHPDRLALGPAT